MRRRAIHALLPLAVLAAAAAAGCGSEASTSTTPSPATTTQSFSGGFTQLGSQYHTFTVSATGTVDISLTAVAPLTTMALGVSLGTWADGSSSCVSAIATNTDARSGTVALTGTAVTGNYCVRIYDSGNVPESGAVTYTINVAHP